VLAVNTKRPLRETNPHPGYDYLLERKLPAVLREAADGPLGEDRARRRL